MLITFVWRTGDRGLVITFVFRLVTVFSRLVFCHPPASIWPFNPTRNEKEDIGDLKKRKCLHLLSIVVSWTGRLRMPSYNWEAITPKSIADPLMLLIVCSGEKHSSQRFLDRDLYGLRFSFFEIDLRYYPISPEQPKLQTQL